MSIFETKRNLNNMPMWNQIKTVYEENKTPLSFAENKKEKESTKDFFNAIKKEHQTEEKDDFLEGFNYYSSKPKQTSQEKFADIRANADKRDWSYKSNISETDDFLQGFNEASEGFSRNNIFSPSNDKITDAKEKLFGAINGVKKEWNSVTENFPWGAVNKISSSANEKGILDDITNTGFKISDSFENSSFNFLGKKNNEERAEKNYQENKKLDLSRYENSHTYINDQEAGAVANVKYGNKTLSENGCGVIAVYNALLSLENRKDIRDIAKDFETGGLVLSGKFGTNPYAIGDYFRENGYEVDTYEGNNLFASLKKSDAKTYIYTYWNSDRAEDGVHIVSIDKSEDGIYRFYNMHCDELLPEKYADELFNGNNVPLVLHCIKKGK